MSTLPRLTARLAVVASFAALVAAACSPDSNGPSNPALLAHREGSGGAAASGFAVLARAAVTCTDGTIIGDVGTFLAAPTGSVTLTNCPFIGTVHVGDAVATQAFNDFLSAYAALAPQPGDVCPIITGTLAGQNLAPGVYCVSAEAKTGVLTLDGQGDANATWIIKVPAGALTGTNFSVVLAGGAQACNVTWWVDAAATMTDSDLKGRILAGAAITLTRGTLNGNASSKADVTITGTAVVGCGAAGPPVCRFSGDRVSGGGFIRLPSGAKGSFGVAGRINIKHNVLRVRGSLELNDHGPNGPKVKSTGVTAYTVLDNVTRRIEGTAKRNGVAGFTFQVDVSDNDVSNRGSKSGRNDTFAIRLFDASGALVYSASGTLGGGNIQLRKAQCDEDDEDDDDDGDDEDDDDHEGD